MVDVENYVAFAHIEIPGNDRGGIDDLDHNLMGWKKLSGLSKVHGLYKMMFLELKVNRLTAKRSTAVKMCGKITLYLSLLMI